MRFEGGFQGRTNKLVDCCYSFWQAGMFPIIHSVLMKGKKLQIFFFKAVFKFLFITDSDYLKQNQNWLFERRK